MVARIVPARFVKFCVVGFSGMFVNMFALFLLADLLLIHTNLSAALAIEISIVSNFVLNDRWTFADRTEQASDSWTRLFRFHAVSLVGAVLQWSTFVLGNYLVGVALIDGFLGGLIDSISAPPDVGPWKYLSQFVGIGLAAVWNFAANLGWTWRQEGPQPGEE